MKNLLIMSCLLLPSIAFSNILKTENTVNVCSFYENNYLIFATANPGLNNGPYKLKDIGDSSWSIATEKSGSWNSLKEGTIRLSLKKRTKIDECEGMKKCLVFEEVESTIVDPTKNYGVSFRAVNGDGSKLVIHCESRML